MVNLTHINKMIIKIENILNIYFMLDIIISALSALSHMLQNLREVGTIYPNLIFIYFQKSILAKHNLRAINYTYSTSSERYIFLWSHSHNQGTEQFQHLYKCPAPLHSSFFPLPLAPGSTALLSLAIGWFAFVYTFLYTVLLCGSGFCDSNNDFEIYSFSCVYQEFIY